MGASKQRWTEEEKSALKAGVVKHGSGKWRTILNDPEFSAVLNLRSNIDLKDKWRNLSITENEWVSREKARMALRKRQQIHKQDENQAALSTADDRCDEILDVEPLAVASANPQPTAAKKPSPEIIIEAIKNLMEPIGSKKTAIAKYIKDHSSAPPPRRWLDIQLMSLVACGRLTKVKGRFRITCNSAISDRRGPRPRVSHLQPRQKEPSRVDGNDVKVPKKSQINPALAQLQNMTAEEAALMAARAVSEAEEAMAEAEEAAREAEEAEADAKAAEAFAEIALRTLERS